MELLTRNSINGEPGVIALINFGYICNAKLAMSLVAELVKAVSAMEMGFGVKPPTLIGESWCQYLPRNQLMKWQQRFGSFLC